MLLEYDLCMYVATCMGNVIIHTDSPLTQHTRESTLAP